MSHLLQIPLDRMLFVGDSDADYRSARQLSVKFVENRFNAELHSKGSLIRDPVPLLAGALSKTSNIGELSRIVHKVDAAMP